MRFFSSNTTWMPYSNWPRSLPSWLTAKCSRVVPLKKSVPIERRKRLILALRTKHYDRHVDYRSARFAYLLRCEPCFARDRFFRPRGRGHRLYGEKQDRRG